MGYADLASAAAQLNLDLAAAADADAVALLAECDDAVSRLFERKAGYDPAQSPIWRGAGATVPATTKTVWGELNAAAVFMLPVPATSISDVQIVGDAPQTLVATDWMAWNDSTLGVARSIRRLNGYTWPSRAYESSMTVTAEWADGPQAADPPELVISACTFLAVEEYRMRSMSPSGEIGPDGMTIRPRNPWNYELVKGALAAVRVAIPAAVFLMSDFHVVIPELPPFVAKMQQAPKIVGEEMGKAGKRVGIRIEGKAKGYAPVKTGTLRRSITNKVAVSPMVTTVTVGTNTPYAKYVEFGRGPITAVPGRMLRFEIGGRVLFRHSVGPANAKPFLYRAFRELRGRISAEFKKVPAAVIARLT